MLPQIGETTIANELLQFYGDIPLLPGSIESRVLRLLPGGRDDPISALVEKLDVADPAQLYNTLSYTWGDANVTKPITVNDEVFQATINLYDALQHIRLADKPVSIWVDAICIFLTSSCSYFIVFTLLSCVIFAGGADMITREAALTLTSC